MKILQLEQGSAEWKAERKKWATASEMASILKIPGAFKSRTMLLKHKIEGEPELSAYTVNMFARGHLVEAELTKYAEEELGMPFQSVVIVDEDLGILASIDNINFEHGVIVETKNSSAAKKVMLAAEFKVWEPYRVQILAQMLVAKVRTGFMCMRDEVTGETFMVPVKPDEEMTKRIIEESATFVQELRKGTVTQLTQSAITVQDVSMARSEA